MTEVETALKQQLDDITECPVCSEDFVDPRTLPCVHTFCFKCIESWSKNAQAGVSLTCPLCRKAFALPVGGVQDLPKNFYMEKMQQVKELSNSQKSTVQNPCNVCSCDKTDPTNRRRANNYCVECEELLCNGCDNYHSKLKATRAHKRLKLADAESLALPYCDEHVTQQLEVYCSDCGTPVCLTCITSSHKSHNFSDFDDAARKYRPQMEAGVSKLREAGTKIADLLSQLEQRKGVYTNNISDIEQAIAIHVNRIKEEIDKEKTKLVSELATMSQTGIDQIDFLMGKMTNDKNSADSLISSIENLSNNGSAGELVLQVNQLYENAEKLASSILSGSLNKELRSVGNVSFQPTEAVLKNGNLVGKLQLQSAQTVARVKSPVTSEKQSPTLTHTMPAGHPVVAMTALNGRLYVARSPSSQKLEVYDTATFKLTTRVVVPGLNGGIWWGHAMTSCAVNNCLYVSDSCNSVHRIHVSKTIVVNWFVDSGPTGLSVNSNHNVLVTCRWPSKIQEYTTNGQLCCEIALPVSIIRPWHAIQLSNDHFVVSHHGPVEGVSTVTADGKLRLSYRNRKKTSVANYSLIEPRQLAVSKSGCVLVADKGRNRIHVMDSTLSRVAEFLDSTIGGGLQEPFAIHLDEIRGRLYVGEYKGGRILVLDNIGSVDAAFC